MEKNNFISNTKILDNFSKGYKVLFSSFWLLVLVTLVYMIIDSFLDDKTISYLFGISFSLGFAAILYTFLIAMPIKMSTSWVFLKVARGDKFEFVDMFAVFNRNYLNAVVGGVLYLVLIMVGVVLLIIPGIIVLIRLSFVDYLIIDKKMKAWDAIRKSWQMTRGHSWKLFGMLLLSILIVILGLLLLIIGVIPAIAWILSSYAVLYNSISMKDKTPLKETTKKSVKKVTKKTVKKAVKK